MGGFPFYQQSDAMDCGPSCLRMVAKYYGCRLSLQRLRTLAETTRSGSSLLGLSKAAEAIGFRTLGVKAHFKELMDEAPLSCIVVWEKNHFVIVHKINKNNIFLIDPAHGPITLTATAETA